MEIANDPSIDVVHVCTPNRSHSEISCACLYGGKHVMCEKPMAKTPAEAKKMLDAAKESGKLLTIGYQNRQYNSSMTLKNAVERGDLGDIYFAKAHALRRRAVPTWGVFLNEYEQGGGPLIDIGTHALNITLWMMNNYKPKMVVGTKFKKLSDQTNTANAWGDWDIEKFTVEDSAFGFIVMENGATISLESSWALNIADPKEASCVLVGDKAGADFFDGLRLNYVKNNRQVIEKPDFSTGSVAFFDGAGKGSPAELEARAWIDAVINDKEVPTKASEALVVTQILEAIYESANTGKPVFID